MKPSQLAQTLQSVLAPYQDRKRWVVAYSGGLDSSVLLHALTQFAEAPAIHVLHIHHGLQAEADEWQRHAQRQARSLSVSLTTVKVSVEEGAGLEDAARRARYAAFEAFLEPGDALLQAHHLDDQVETLLLRMFRGTGVDGLKGMPASRELGEALLVRPLLNCPRSELEDYARAKGLDWIDDPSNDNTAFDRNYLRHTVLPLVEARWPAYRAALGRLSDLAAAVLPNDKLSTLTRYTRHSVWPAMDLEALRKLDEGGRNAGLRQWLSQATLTPSLAQLQALQKSMLWSSADAEPVFEFGDFQVRRFQEALYITRLREVDRNLALDWSGSTVLVLPGAGKLSVVGLAGEEDFTVRLRRGGERCQPAGRPHSQRLKKLLQEAGVPPWLRNRLPLIYLNGELAAVADLWICEGFARRLAGWRFVWEPED